MTAVSDTATYTRTAGCEGPEEEAFPEQKNL